MDNTDFHLQFQEFEDESEIMDKSPQETAINIDRPITKPQKPRRTAGGTSLEEENDPLESDDKTKLLSGQRERSPFWTFEYYQAFFDVDTRQVKDRIIGSILPWPGKNFVRLYIRNNPDLYGPFWICATLVFAIGISGNMSSFFVHHGQPQYKYVPDFRKVTMAATAIYSYAWLVPLILWGVLAWRNSRVTNMVTYSFLEIVCVYGYSLSIYIPAVVLWIIPNEGLRWCSIVVALCLSGSVLVFTFLPALRDDRPRVVMAITSTIVALHVLLAVGCKAFFFSTYEKDLRKVVIHAAVNKTLSVTTAQ
ncbi:protein YIPF1 [Brachyhypopomus gauderio]|uniref:protein YIPF1 n=1 Tax=Brachyhypopomus gauderio TaxID=698409 RepID=UPI004042135B